ncbi:MAG: DMT family transporter [Acuticoccus sp.]
MAMTDNVRGSILMTVSMAAFVTNDTLMKVVFETIPVAQTLFFRGLIATSLILLMAWRTGALFYRAPRSDLPALILRAIGEVGATGFFMLALSNIPIANAVAVLQAAPLAVTMAAALFLGEEVGWRRWSAIGVGFVGMLIIVQPGAEGFNAYALYAVLAVFFITLRDIGTRRLAPGTPTLWASVLSAAIVTIGSGLIIPLEGWRPMGGTQYLLVFGASLFVIVGYVTHVGSVRFGEISAVAPFRYTVLIFALMLGFLIFGEIPDTMTLVGGAVVTGAGLYTIWRERRLGRSISARASSRPFNSDLKSDA